MAAGFWTRFGRFILVFLNFFIVLLSVAVIGLGIVLKYFSASVITNFVGTVESLTNQTRTDFHIRDINQLTELPFLEQAGVALIILGSILFCLSFLPCCGACCMWRPLLVLFVVLMSAFLVCQAVAGALFLTKDSQLHNTIKETMGKEVRDTFDAKGEDVLSFTVNLLNYMLDCCGIRGQEDFPEGQRPPSCCNRTIIDGDEGWSSAKNMCLAEPPTAPDSFYNQQGCYSVLQDEMLSNLSLSILILPLVLFFEFLEIVFACMLVKDLNERTKVGPYK